LSTFISKNWIKFALSRWTSWYSLLHIEYIRSPEVDSEENPVMDTAFLFYHQLSVEIDTIYLSDFQESSNEEILDLQMIKEL